VLKEDARTRLAVGTFGYNSNIQRLDVLAAHTAVGGKTITVPTKTIEDKPVASSVLGFDELHQVLVPFPRRRGRRVAVREGAHADHGGGLSRRLVGRIQVRDTDARARRPCAHPIRDPAPRRVA
jgi:hypothetical protein